MDYYFSVPVEYVKPLSDVEVKEGETATLTCEINKANATAIWSKDGEKITPDDSKYTITTEDYTHTLIIKDCQIEDDSEYTISIEDTTSVGNVFVEGLSLSLSIG